MNVLCLGFHNEGFDFDIKNIYMKNINGCLFNCKEEDILTMENDISPMNTTTTAEAPYPFIQGVLNFS